MWTLILPYLIAFKSNAPLSSSAEQSLTWAFITLILRMPVGVITDRIVAMSQFLAPKTVEDKWNYNMVLWRSSQLYVCSSAYTLLSIISGTKTAFMAAFFDGDNTMWSSYRISQDQLAKARNEMKTFGACPYFNFRYHMAVYYYLRLNVQAFSVAIGMPDVLTTYFVMMIIAFQLVCIFASVQVTNKRNASMILVTVVICAFNFALTVDIALLLMPFLQNRVGRPVRLEYVFATISTALIISLICAGNIMSLDYWKGIFFSDVHWV
jgi:hypothetical protein